MKRVFLDSETCGFTGPAITFQHLFGDSYSREQVDVHHIWLSPIKQSMELMEKFCESEVVGFNLAYDWFHVVKLYNHFASVRHHHKGADNWYPYEHVEEIYHTPPGDQDLCLRPAMANDLWLHALETKWQITMERKPINIRRVPKVLAAELCEFLNNDERFTDPESPQYLSPLLFGNRKKDRSVFWKVRRPKTKDDPFRDVYLSFKPTSKLKAFAKYLLNREDIVDLKETFGDTVPPVEYGWAWPKCQWKNVILQHIQFWSKDERAKKYAIDDIDYTWSLWDHFGRPSGGSYNSELACMVGAVRWRGFAVDVVGLQSHQAELKEKAKVPSSPTEVKQYLLEVATPEERLGLRSTAKAALEKIVKSIEKQSCEFCGGTKCTWCEGIENKPSLMAQRAKTIIEGRSAGKELELIDKLVFAGRMFAGLKVIGTMSDRMAGDYQFNVQGIKKDKRVRQYFLMWGKSEGMGNDTDKLGGGDFDSFEVGIACEFFGDKDLEKMLRSGKKMHGVFGSKWYGQTYDEIQATDGTENDLYTKAKSGVFLYIYGGEAKKLASTLGISEERAIEGLRLISAEFPGVISKRQEVFDRFAALVQPIAGRSISYQQPDDFVETLLKFRRYFTLENAMIDYLYHMAQKLPPQFKKYTQTVKRRDREQKAWGALMTALFAAAFNIQANDQRAAANHVIQGTGGGITKRVQIAVWQEHQPIGVNRWIVQLLNIHDEILAVVAEGFEAAVKKTILQQVEKYRSVVPLLNMKWKRMPNWGAKKDGSIEIEDSW